MARIVFFLLLVCIVVLPACREQSKEEIFQQGMAFVNSGNYQAAVSLFKDALEKDPNYIDARLQLGVAYLETDKLDKAENELEKVLRQDPDNYEVSLRFAQIYLQTKRTTKAIQTLSELEKKHPNDPDIQTTLGQSYALEGDYNFSEARYRKALDLQPSNLKSQLGLAQVLFVTDRADEALQLLQKTVVDHPQSARPYYLKFKYALQQGKRDEAVKSLEQIRSIDPEDIGATYMLALLYLDAGELDKGRLLAENIESDSPGHPAGSRVKGVYLYLKGDYENAIIAIQKSLRGMPDLPGFYLSGLINYRLNQFELALSSFQKALDKNPDHDQSRLMVAQTLLKQGRIEDCIREARNVLERNPENGQAYNILGSAYLAQGQYDLAMQELNKAIEVDPSLAGAHLKKGLFNLASGNKRQGVVDLQSALAAAPEILNTRLLLATYHLKQHNYPMVIKVLAEGLNGSSDDALIYNYMAAAYFAQNKQDEAVASLEKAKKSKQDYLSPYFNLANFYISRGDNQAALDEFLAALAVVPNNLQVHLKLASLYELTGDTTKAEQHYLVARETGEASGFIAYAAFFARSGQKEKSLEVLKEGYANHPDNPLLMVALGSELQKLKQFDAAIKIYIHLEETSPGKGLPLLVGAQLHKGDFAAANEIAGRVITEHPKAEYGYLMLSAIHEYRKEWSSAETAIKNGLKFNENSTILNMNLARIYSMQGEYDESQSIYDTILTKHPNYIPAIFGKGAIYDLLGNKRKAQDLYKQILDKDENYTPALNNLAYLNLEVYEDNKEALKLAVKAFRNSPGSASVMDTLGYALLKNGKAEDAIPFLEKAIILMPQEASINLHLAQAYKAVGRNDDAVTSLNTINETNAQEAQIVEAKALLKELN